MQEYIAPCIGKYYVNRLKCRSEEKEWEQKGPVFIRSDEGLSLETSAIIHTFDSSPPFLFWLVIFETMSILFQVQVEACKQ